MIMTNEEICREYRQAKNKSNQIAILADQNQCDRKEILTILLESGEKVDKRLIGHPNPRKSDAGRAVPVKKVKTRKIHLTAAEADALGRFLEDTLPAQLPKMELPDIHELTGIYKKLL